MSKVASGIILLSIVNSDWLIKTLVDVDNAYELLFKLLEEIAGVNVSIANSLLVSVGIVVNEGLTVKYLEWVSNVLIPSKLISFSNILPNEPLI